MSASLAHTDDSRVEADLLILLFDWSALAGSYRGEQIRLDEMSRIGVIIGEVQI
jgi:hypothetical protein